MPFRSISGVLRRTSNELILPRWMTRRILWLASQTALLLGVVSVTTAYASSPVAVGGVQTQIAATGISYSGSNCQANSGTQVAGEWCGPVGIATDSQGNIYVGQYTAGQLIKLDAGTHAPTILLNAGTSNGLGHPQQIAMDSNDNLWITDPDNSRVVEYSTTSNAIVATYPTVAYPFAIGVDSSNNVWVNGGGAIYEIPAGTASGTTVTLKISAAATGFTSIWGIAFDNSGNLWVANNPSPNVSGFATGTIAEFTLASSFATKNTVLTSTTLYGPGQILFDPSNNMYVAEDNINSVVKFNYSSSYTYGYSASDSYAISNTVASAEAVARDSNGNLFLTAYGGGLQSNSAVVEISPGGVAFPDQAVGTTSSTNVTVNFYVQSGATIGSFAVLDQGVSGLEFNRVTNASTDCTVGAYSSTTVCSIQASFKPTQPGVRYGAIQALDASGTALATAYLYGTGVGSSIAYRPGTLSTVLPTTAGVTSPFGIAFDPSGNMYVTDLSGGVKKFASGSTSGTAIGSGWGEPTSIKVDGAGNLWIANCDSSSVIKETPDGSGGYTQSTAFSGFICPTGVDLDGAGNVYIASRWNYIVYKETLSNGTYTQSTIASGLSTLADLRNL
jgi:streptogramin lyase